MDYTQYKFSTEFARTLEMNPKTLTITITIFGGQIYSRTYNSAKKFHKMSKMFLNLRFGVREHFTFAADTYIGRS